MESPTSAMPFANDTSSPSRPAPAPQQTDGFISTLSRKWCALRWQLSRALFSRPVPFMAHKFDATVGDALITGPIVLTMAIFTLISVAKQDVGASGKPVSMLLMLAFAFTVRNNSVLLATTGISFERAIQYHKAFAKIGWILSGLHALSYLLNYVNEGKEFKTSTVVSGVVTLVVLILLMTSSMSWIRRRYYHLFVYMHWVFFVLLVVTGVIHGAGLLLVGFVPWLVDNVFRHHIQKNRYSGADGVIHERHVSLAMATADTIRIQFPRTRSTSDNNDTDTKHATFDYRPAQHVYLCFPSIARFEWHPFTIASAPREPMVTLYIKVLGDWTQRLAGALQQRAIPSLVHQHQQSRQDRFEPQQSQPYYQHQCQQPFPSGLPSNVRLTMLMDGPYGAPSIELDHYTHFVLVSGGVGVTPMLSIVNHLYHESEVEKTRRQRVEQVSFVWSVRDRSLVEGLLIGGTEAANPEARRPITLYPWLPVSRPSEPRPNDVKVESSSARVPFQTEVYLTRADPDPSHVVDQTLQASLHFAKRPDIDRVLRETGEQAKRDGKCRVGVLVCGPKSMIREVAVQSALLSGASSDVIFDVHHETFDF